MPHRTHGFHTLAALLAVALTSACATGATPPTAPVASLGVAIDRGEAIARQKCAACHAVGPTGDSPATMAPPFRALAQDLPAPSLEDRLLAISDLGHQEMRPAGLDASEVRDLVAYLETLD